MTLDEIKKRYEEIISEEHSEYKTKLLMGIEKHLEEYDEHFLLANVKHSIIKSAVFSGQVEIAIAYFSWLISVKPHIGGIQRVLNINSAFSWLLEISNYYPSISLEKTNEFFRDFEKFCLENDVSLLNLYKNKTLVAQGSGDHKLADENYRMWINTKRDFFSDCRACNMHDKVIYAINSGDVAKADEKIRELFGSDYKCAEVPLFSYPVLAVHYFKLGRFEEAYRNHRLGLDGLKNNKKMIFPVSRHILYCANKDTDKALDLFISYSHHLVRLTNVRERLNFYVGAYVLFNNLLSDGQEKVSMNIDGKLPYFDPTHEYSCSKLKEFFYDEILRLSNLFNQRNNNVYVLDQVKENIRAFSR